MSAGAIQTVNKLKIQRTMQSTRWGRHTWALTLKRLKCSVQVLHCFLTHLIYLLFICCLFPLCTTKTTNRVEQASRDDSAPLCYLHKLAFLSFFGLLQQAIALINSLPLSDPPTSYLSDADCHPLHPPLILPSWVPALCTCIQTLIVCHVWHI